MEREIIKALETAFVSFLSAWIVVTLLMNKWHKWANSKKIFLIFFSAFSFWFIFSGVIQLLLQLLSDWAFWIWALDLDLVSNGITWITTLLVFPTVIKLYEKDTFDKVADLVNKKVNNGAG